MADLPKERLSQEPPFTYCGIDMFGPILGVFSHIFQVEQFILNLQFHYLSMMISDELWIVNCDDERSLFSSRDHCQRPSPSRISDTPRAGFEPAQNLSSGFDEWSCAVVITTTPRRQDAFIQALWRFVSRRGNVRVIRTDKGRNYVGASAELNKAFSEMNLYQIFIVQFRYVQCNYWQWNQGLLCHPQESFRKKTYIVGNSGDVCNT